MKQGALTIVSKNYISQARVLAGSFLENNPNSEFWVLLVDELDDDLDLSNEVFNWIPLSELPLPGKDYFPYQYTILELNTAVKPFMLDYLFSQEKFDKLCYIDPDILILKELTHVWDALDDNNVVLTPHMSSPFEDNMHPSELNILQSGTYNLGFIGLKRGEETDRLLSWWSERLYLDCVVDIPRGLFVDQKWMDLAPAYFKEVYILHHPGYNVAYWNLHERSLSKKGDKYYVNNEEIHFFHFSGYKPDRRNVLSKHQNRHILKNNPLLKSLCDFYGDLMEQEGFQETKELDYHYETLPNGVKISPVIIKLIRDCLKSGVKIPSPQTDPEEFCQFMIKINPKIYGLRIAPLYTSLLEVRPDVKEAYPEAVSNPKDPGFSAWLKTNGMKECDLIELFEINNNVSFIDSPVRKITELLSSRMDLKVAYPNVATDKDTFQEFINWCYSYGIDEEGLSANEIEAFRKSANGLTALLNIYFSRADLQQNFLSIGDSRILKNLINWFIMNLSDFESLDYDDLCYIEFFADEIAPTLNLTNILYNSWLRSMTRDRLNIVNYEEYRIKLFYLGIHIEENDAIEFLLNNEKYQILNQLEIATANFDKDLFKYDSSIDFQSVKSIKELISFIELNETTDKINELRGFDYASLIDKKGINVFGYFNSPTGMGESVRSLCRWLEEKDIPYNKITIPNQYSEPSLYFDLLNEPMIFGWPNSGYPTNIIVANADSIDHIRKFIPDYIWNKDKTNIGYWVWETENFPHFYKETSRFFKEIWTPSEYAAGSISKVVDCEVKVVPHVVDNDLIDKIRRKKPDRNEFGLENKLTFGFFFDQKSVMKRKNPEGIIDAFQSAFKDSSKVQLILKVNSAHQGDFHYECLKQKTSKTKNIIWIEETFSKEKTMRLMNCIDVYISLHRAEGFGLTLLEAKMLGKKVIASDYSGNVDFMGSKTDFLIPVKRINLNKNYGPYLKGSAWGEPDIKLATKAMQEIFNSH